MSELFGHEHILQGLAGAAASHRLSHAYIFEGAEGIGKHTAVHWLSRVVMCRNGGDCGICEDCVKLKAGSHPDLIIAEESFFQSDKIKAGSVEAMRILRQDAYTKPFMSSMKLFVIPRADEMLAPAQNTLLKILEEPPSYCIFVLLCTNANKLLETVRSRSVLLRFFPLNDTHMMSFLQTHYEEEKARLLLRPSGGIPGRALQIAEDDAFLQRRDMAADLFCSFFQTGDLIPVSTFLDKERDCWEEILEGLSELTLDAATVCCGRNAGSAQAKKLASLLEVGNLITVCELLQKAIEKSRANANFSLTVTDLLMQCQKMLPRQGKEKING